MKVNHHISQAKRRTLRVRKKVRGTSARPRLTVFRSNKHVYLQVINDEVGKTIVSASDVEKVMQASMKGKKQLERAKLISQDLYEKLKKAKVSAIVFDRGPYRYHGTVKLIAEYLREQGVQL